jgi:uncharacterized protein
MKNNNTLKSIYIFYIATLGLSSVFYYFIIKAEIIQANNQLYAYASMWCPAVAAFLTASFFKISFLSFGFKPSKIFGNVLAFFLPLIYFFIGYKALWIFKISPFHFPHFGSPAQLLYGFLITFLLALGEEIGWRGLLVPQLNKQYSLKITALLSGFLWAFWHIPLIILTDYGSTAPVWFSIPVFIINITCLGVIAAYLRIKTKSLWPPVLLHASHNFFLFGFLNQMVSDTYPLQFFTGECGIAITVPLLASALYCLLKQR